MTAQPNAPFFPSGDLKTRLHFHRPAAKALASLVTSPWSLVVSAGGLHRITRAGVLDDIPPPTAITIATTMIATCSAIPTAVITESSENTMSSSRIWLIAAAKLIFVGSVPSWSAPAPSTWWKISLEAL